MILTQCQIITIDHVEWSMTKYDKHEIWIWKLTQATKENINNKPILDKACFYLEEGNKIIMYLFKLQYCWMFRNGRAHLLPAFCPNILELHFPPNF